jgi:hypothetical protein
MKNALLALVLIILAMPSAGNADAVLYVSPERGTYIMGQMFEVKIYADSGGKLINAAEGNLSFSTEALEVVDLSTDESILQSWSTPPEFSNEEGTIHFAGWTKKNYSGPNALLLTITFKALRNMTGTARFAAGAILAADGIETNIITSMRSGVFTIAPQEKPDYTPDLSGSSSSTSESEVPAMSAKIPPPVFDNAPSSVAIGDRIVVRGNAEPNARIFFYLARGSESEMRSELLSASDGSFTFVSEEPVTEGVYHLRASAETDDGRQSLQSEVVDITVAPAGVAASAIFGASLMLETVPFLALLIFGGLGAAYIFHRHQIAKMHYGRHSMFDQR